MRPYSLLCSETLTLYKSLTYLLTFNLSSYTIYHQQHCQEQEVPYRLPNVNIWHR